MSTRSTASTRKRSRQKSEDRSVLSIGMNVELEESGGAWVSAVVQNVRPKYAPDFSSTDLRRKRKRLRPSRGKHKPKPKTTPNAATTSEPGCLDTWILLETESYREWVLYEKDGLIRLPAAPNANPKQPAAASAHNTRSKATTPPQTPVPAVEELLKEEASQPKSRTVSTRKSAAEQRSRKRAADETETLPVPVPTKSRKISSSVSTRSSRKSAKKAAPAAESTSSSSVVKMEKDEMPKASQATAAKEEEVDRESNKQRKSRSRATVTSAEATAAKAQIVKTEIEAEDSGVKANIDNAGSNEEKKAAAAVAKDPTPARAVKKPAAADTPKQAASKPKPAEKNAAKGKTPKASTRSRAKQSDKRKVGEGFSAKVGGCVFYSRLMTRSAHIM